jgi:hypothetical protein
LTQDLGGVISFAVALFDLSTVSYAKLALDVVETILAIVASMIGLFLSRNLRGGTLQEPVTILALSPLLMAVVQVLQFLDYLAGPTVSMLLQEVFELSFLVVLCLGFFMLHRTVENMGEAGQGKV